MKKFLSLVLALVMTMSLVTVAGAEDFTDDSKINYAEAVEVMSAIDVIDGYTDGSFNPQGTLTRGAAAKIICNMILGPTTAGALSANEAPFKDVPADHTFAGYISFCASEGIISGYADGSFRPAGTLTGYAFMKMLLGALGYDATIEGYTGTNWAIQVAKRALNLGLNNGLEGSFVGTKAITREEACLYAFNTLKTRMVDYGNKSTITVGDLTITTSAEAEDVYVGNADTDKIDNKGYQEFAEKYFPDLKLNKGQDDAYGRPSHIWKNGKTTIGNYADAPVLTYTAEIKGTDLAEELDDAGLKIKGDVKYYVNGKDNVKTIAKADVEAALAATDAVFGNGILVEVYSETDAADDDVVTEIVAVATYVGKVTSVRKDKTSTKADESALVIEVLSPVKGYTTTATAEDTEGFEAIYDGAKVDDLVLVVPKNDEAGKALVVSEIESITGKITSVKNGVATIDGEEYEVAALATGIVASNKVEKTVYVDEYGYIIYSKDVDADKTLFYVAGIYTGTDKYNNETKYVQAVTMDGEIVELALAEGQNPSTGVLYAYEETTDGVKVSEYTAKQAVAIEDATKITSKDVKVAGKYYADEVETIFVELTAKGSDYNLAKTKVAVAEGLKNIASTSDAYAILNSDGEVITVISLGTAAIEYEADELLFVNSTESIGNGLDEKDNYVLAYEGYIAGEKVSFLSASAPADKGFYTYTVKDGVWTLTPAENAGYGYVTAHDEYITVAGKVDYTLAADVEVYDLSDNAYMELVSLADIENLLKYEEVSNIAAWVIYDDTDKEIDSIYVYAVV